MRSDLASAGLSGALLRQFEVKGELRRGLFINYYGFYLYRKDEN